MPMDDQRKGVDTQHLVQEVIYICGVSNMLWIGFFYRFTWISAESNSIISEKKNVVRTVAL